MADIYRADISDVDLSKPLTRGKAVELLATGDKLANRFGAAVYRDKAKIDLAGYVVTGYFIRPGHDTVVISGTVSGNTAYVDLPQACYIDSGSFSIAIKISGSGITQTVRIIDGFIRLTQTDDLVDPGTTVPSLDDILGQIAACEAATSAANTAAAEAHTAAENAGMYSDGYYQGIDLTVKFADEIAGYSDPWAWIRARIRAGNYTGIHVCDYIPFTTTNGYTFQAQVGGINTYKGYGDAEIGNHIDFISRELWPDSFKMNLVNFNNGTEAAEMPWLASNGYLYLNSLAGQVPNGTTLPLVMADVDYTAGGIYYYLPDALKNVIVEKCVYATTRYSASGVLTNDNGGAWVNLGKLWLPDEYETIGEHVMTNTGWFSGGSTKYQIFTNNMNRLKKVYGNRGNWWMSSTRAGSSVGFVIIGYDGLEGGVTASTMSLAPICFRIA